jgi:hypothetical protein
LAIDPEARVRFPALRKKIVGLERCPLSLVSTTEELLDRKVAAPVYKTENTAVGIRHDDHVAPFIRKSWQSLRRQVAVARSVQFARGLRPWSLVLVTQNQVNERRQQRLTMAVQHTTRNLENLVT